MSLDLESIERLDHLRDRLIRYKYGCTPSSYLTDFLHYVVDDTEWLMDMVVRLGDESDVSLEALDGQLSDAKALMDKLKAIFQATGDVFEENRAELERLRSSPQGRLVANEAELRRIKGQLSLTFRQLSEVKQERDKLKAIVDSLPPTRHEILAAT